MGVAFRFWALTEVAGLAATPVAAFLFARLPGGGLALARPIALLLMVYPAWLLASAHVVAYGMLSALLGMVLLTLLGAGLWLRSGRDFLKRSRSTWQLWLAGEVLFALGFFGWTVLRSYAPDVWQTEKPMDMAFINAINRTSWFPPPDPWLSGAPINYYYFGHYLVSFLIRVSSVRPEVGYNLGVALFFALTLSSVFAVASALYLAAQREGRARDGFAVVVGLTAAAFALLLGNLAGGVQLVSKAMPLASFDWWSPSRVIANTANEFPFFSYLLGDLHAHSLVSPFSMVALAFALQVALAGPRPGLTIATAAELLLAALVTGSLYAINSLDYPTSVALVLLGLLLWATRERRAGSRWHTLVWAGAWLGLSAVLFIAFWFHFLPSAAGVGLLPDHAGFQQFLHDYALLYGLPLWVLGSALASRLGTLGLRGRAIVWNGVPAVALLVLLAPARLDGLVVLAALLAIALQAALLGGGAQALRLFWLLVAAGVGLIALSEAVFIRDAFIGTASYRFNTVFKLGYQAWFLFAIAAGVGAFWFSSRMRPEVRRAWLAGVGVLVGLAAVYPIAGTFAREAAFSRPPTLDGLAWLAARSPGDVSAIRWMQSEIRGSPTILETVGTDYDAEGRGRVSTFTGLPTVLGWAGHEVQWSHPPGARFEDVRVIYSTLDPLEARRLLAQYGVRYVFVGWLEHLDYSSAALEKFSRIATVVYSGKGTLVYRLDDP